MLCVNGNESKKVDFNKKKLPTIINFILLTLKLTNKIKLLSLSQKDNISLKSEAHLFNSLQY